MERLREAGLTIKPGKCQFGYTELEFLGNRVGNGVKKPSKSKIEKIQSASFPKRKKQVRAFLGLCGFLRSYIPNFSSVAAPLTDATRKGEPNEVRETEVRVRAFENLKKALCSEAILKLPDLEKDFYLQTDSSQDALGEYFSRIMVEIVSQWHMLVKSLMKLREITQPLNVKLWQFTGVFTSS